MLRYLEGGTVHSLDLGAAVTSGWRGSPLYDAVLSPDGRTLATAEVSGAGYVFRLLDPGSGRLLRTLPTAHLPVAADGGGPVVAADTVPVMAFGPEGTSFAYGVSAPGRAASAQSLTLWDTGSGRVRSTLDLTPSAPAPAVESLALGPGGRTLVAVRDTAEGRIGEVWDTATRRRTARLGEVNPTALGLRPDGRLLVGGDRLARLPSGPAGARTLGLGEEIEAVAFSADGSRVAVGDASGRVALWDGDLGHRLGVLPSTYPAPLPDGAPEAVSALAFSPDGGTLAVAGDSGTLQLWDTAGQEALGDGLTTPGEGIVSLAFAPRGGTLYATSPHAPLQRYPVTSSHAAAAICAGTATTLSPAQWHTYIQDAPYRDVCPAA